MSPQFVSMKRVSITNKKQKCIQRTTQTKKKFEGIKLIQRSKLTEQRLDRWLLWFGGFLQFSCKENKINTKEQESLTTRTFLNVLHSMHTQK